MGLKFSGGQLNVSPRAGGTSGSIDDLYDVVITNPVLNDILTYDSAVPAWKNVSLIAGNGLTQTFFQLDKTLTVVAAANGGITVSANGVSVNNTVVRTTGDFTLAGNITINGILTTNNSSNIIDATTLDSQDSTYYRNATNINAGTLAAARLATSGVTAGTYGSSSAIPVLTVDDKGRVTVATTVAMVASSETVSGAVRFATAAETNASTSAALAVSPLNLATYYAKKTSPTLTGTPLAPTASLGNNTTQIATTEFVNSEIANDAVLKTGSTMTGNLVINNTSPTIRFQDTDSLTGFIHCNSDLFYILRGEVNSTTWTQVNGQWPMYLNLTNNNAQFGGSVYAVGDVAAYSDIRLKTDIAVIPDALDKVSTLRGVTYTRTDSGLKQTGLIAQEVQAVLPEAVHTSDDEAQTLSVAYGNLAGLLVEAIKELKEESKRQAIVIAEQAMIIEELTKRIK